MKLQELSGRLVRYVYKPDPEGKKPYVSMESTTVEMVSEAHAVELECPLKEVHRKDRRGHHVRIYFEGHGLDPGVLTGPTYKASGTSLDDLTLEPDVELNRDAPVPVKPGAPDVCRWKGSVRNGEVSSPATL